MLCVAVDKKNIGERKMLLQNELQDYIKELKERILSIRGYL